MVYKGTIFTEEQYQFLKQCKKDRIIRIIEPSQKHEKILEELLKEDLVKSDEAHEYIIKKDAYNALKKEWWLRDGVRFMFYLVIHPDRPLNPRKYPDLKRWQRW